MGHICLDMKLYDVCDKTSVLVPTKKSNKVAKIRNRYNQVPEHISPSRWHVYKSDIWLHWNFYIMPSLGILGHCSLWRNERYFQWEILSKSYESISECSS